MSSEQGTLLRNGKIISLMSVENTSSNNAMAESSITESEVNDGSDISSQLSGMKEKYERKIGELQSEFSQLKDLLMAIINKSNRDSPSTSFQGLSKRPQMGEDIRLSRKNHQLTCRLSKQFKQNVTNQGPTW